MDGLVARQVLDFITGAGRTGLRRIVQMRFGGTNDQGGDDRLESIRLKLPVHGSASATSLTRCEMLKSSSEYKRLP
jgi:hypothetical protein